MNLNEEPFDAIEEMAGLFFSAEQVAANLELTEKDTEYFVAAIECKNMKNPLVAAYYKGWITAEMELRKAIKLSALNGSSPSQQMMMNLQKENTK